MLKTQARTALSHLLRSHTRQPLTLTPHLKTLIAHFTTSPYLCRNPKETTDSEEQQRDPEGPPLLLVVQPRVKQNAQMKAKLSEALNLANSLDEQRDGSFSTDLSLRNLPPHLVVQNPLSGPRKGRADTYFGHGTVNNIKCHINAVESQQGELDGVFVNAILSAIQQRNLEREWGRPVLDRVGLIIEIFHAHAYTKEAKLQAELAALMYKKSRLVRVRGTDGRYTFGALGEAEVVSARGRGSGGQGFVSGAGETELELQRRRISDRRKRLLAEIAVVRRTRAVQRAARQKQGAVDGQRLATVAVVGYTNAGKSTLVSALSHSDLYSDDRLFATVDPKVRGVALPSGRKALLSDTVGFISDLPVQLVEAFHATLEEVAEADLLVHVLDSSAPNLDEHRKAVLDVLRQIGVSEKKIQDMIEVWNKIDIEADADEEKLEHDSDHDFFEVEAKMADEQLENETVGEQNEYSDGSLELDAKDESDEDITCDSMVSTTSDSQTTGCIAESQIEDVASEVYPLSEGRPHVKSSAVTGVGLKELLKLIDEKLVQIDIDNPSERSSERNVYHRKWRPPQVEDVGISVEN